MSIDTVRMTVDEAQTR